jgi:hypothetical protein
LLGFVWRIAFRLIGRLVDKAGVLCMPLPVAAIGRLPVASGANQAVPGFLG